MYRLMFYSTSGILGKIKWRLLGTDSDYIYHMSGGGSDFATCAGHTKVSNVFYPLIRIYDLDDGTVHA